MAHEDCLAFASSEFNGDVSGWNTTLVDHMEGLFSYSPFNGDLSAWDTSSVISMENMFEGNCEFVGEGIEGWDTRRVLFMGGVSLLGSEQAKVSNLLYFSDVC